jgi:hypothetical protein
MVDSSILRKIMATALVGFLLVGGAAVGCVVFGIFEIVSSDAIFLNDGLGEVLTVLGIYFTVPYLFCVFAFLIVVLRPKLRMMNNRDYFLLSGITIVLYVLQQAITDKYLTILVGMGSLALVVGDAAVLAAMLYYGVDHPRPIVLYVVLYVTKMAVQYNKAYETDQQSFFGPNGVSVMLFLCIPVIQFPMYVMGGGSGNSNVDIVAQFARNFNLFLSHLLSSLDIISLYGFAFTKPESTANTAAAPTPFKNLILILVIVGFLGNNLAVIYLFYQRDGTHHAEIPFMPQKFKEVSRHADGGEDAEASSHQRRLFHYMLFMLVVCDVPMLLTRLELWRQQYAPLNIFVAKNIKGIVDAIMLVLRADHSNEGLSRTSVTVRGRASTTVGAPSPSPERRLL